MLGAAVEWVDEQRRRAHTRRRTHNTHTEEKGGMLRKCPVIVP